MSGEEGVCPVHGSGDRPAQPLPRMAEVGWILNAESAHLIWSPPRRVMRQRPEKRHAKSLTQCPAVVDTDARLYEILCPIDAALGFRFNAEGRPVLVNLAGDQSAIRSNHLNKMVVIVDRKEWAHPERPVIQFKTPYIFVSDEYVWVNQLPAFNFYRKDPMPGLMVPGRLPIDIWPRGLMWAFEWYETGKPLILRRGEPWWYARFEHFDPARSVRLVEAEMTEELRVYMRGLAGVTNYVNQTFQLFHVARERRPEKLLTPKKRPIAMAAEDEAAALPALQAEAALAGARDAAAPEPVVLDAEVVGGAGPAHPM